MQSADKSASAIDITVVHYSCSIEFDCALLLLTDWRHMIEMQILVMLVDALSSSDFSMKLPDSAMYKDVNTNMKALSLHI